MKSFPRGKLTLILAVAIIWHFLGKVAGAIAPSPPEPAPSTSYRAVDREIEAPLAIVWEAGEPHKSCPGEQGSTLHIRPPSAAKRKDWEGSPVPEINLVPLLPGMWLGFSLPG